VHHVAGAGAVSRHELGVLIARRDGLDATALPAGLRASTSLPGPIDVRLTCATTQARPTTRLRGAREFLTPAVDTGARVTHPASFARASGTWRKRRWLPRDGPAHGREGRLAS
jgi:hypothetical protein